MLQLLQLQCLVAWFGSLWLHLPQAYPFRHLGSRPGTVISPLFRAWVGPPKEGGFSTRFPFPDGAFRSRSGAFVAHRPGTCTGGASFASFRADNFPATTACGFPSPRVFARTLGLSLVGPSLYETGPLALPLAFGHFSTVSFGGGLAPRLFFHPEGGAFGTTGNHFRDAPFDHFPRGPRGSLTRVRIRPGVSHHDHGCGAPPWWHQVQAPIGAFSSESPRVPCRTPSGGPCRARGVVVGRSVYRLSRRLSGNLVQPAGRVLDPSALVVRSGAFFAAPRLCEFRGELSARLQNRSCGLTLAPPSDRGVLRLPSGRTAFGAGATPRGAR